MINKKNATSINLNNLSICKLEEIHIADILLIEKKQNIKISTETILKNAIKSSTNKYYVAYLEDNIVGYFGIDILPDFIDILTIVVKEEFKRKHIASFFLEEIFEIAKENNIQKILLEVRKSNIPAQKLYNKFGFKQISIRKNYYNNPNEDAIILIKEC